MNFVPCVTWVSRGLANRTPQKVTLTKEELKQIIEENQHELEKLQTPELSECESDEGENGRTNNNNNNNNNIIINVSTNDENNSTEVNNDDYINSEYGMDNYDDEDDAAVNSLAGLAAMTLYASNEEDPYMTIKEDDEDSDVEDFEIRPDDNLIVSGHVIGGDAGLDVYVFNEKDDDLYVHHDIILTEVPLCIEWMNFDPSEEDPGNFVAVGTMAPVIEIWDLDVVGSLEPSFMLGRKKVQQQKPKKRKTEKISGHSDAVLDLSWNHFHRNLLASASADHTVALWDMAEGSVITNFTEFTDKAQTLEWHKSEDQIIVAGSYDKTTRIIDCRTVDSSIKTWTLDGEVERVVWNPQNRFIFHASTDQGSVYAIDKRLDEPIWKISAHSKACTALALNSLCPGVMITASTDKSVKIWDIKENEPEFVYELHPNTGQIHCLQSNPNCPYIICCGGDKRSKNFKVLNLTEFEEVTQRFSNRLQSNRLNVESTNVEISIPSTSRVRSEQEMHRRLEKKAAKKLLKKKKMN